jgi:hypothetical protein
MRKDKKVSINLMYFQVLTMMLGANKRSNGNVEQT